MKSNPVKENGKLIKEALRPTLFVPMTGEAEDRRDVKPDPKNPRAINGNFEIPPLENGFIIGWYYQRQVTSDTKTAREGNCISIQNEQLGRAGHLLQGIPIDGRHVEKRGILSGRQDRRCRRQRTRKRLPNRRDYFLRQGSQIITHVTMGRFTGNRIGTTLNAKFECPPTLAKAF